MKVIQLHSFKDNYIYLLKNDLNEVAVIDPGDAEVVTQYLEENHLTLKYILNTHHHWDHVDGNEKLIEKYHPQVICSKKDLKRVPGATHGVIEGEKISFEDISVLETFGHTSGHISFYSKKYQSLFCGDTLFFAGCGRVFDGTLEELYNSLQKLKALPLETKVYCTHEYTLSNLRFARHLNPNDEKLKITEVRVKALREDNKVSIPYLLKDDIDINPFLTAQSLEVFIQRRQLKDQF